MLLWLRHTAQATNDLVQPKTSRRALKSTRMTTTRHQMQTQEHTIPLTAYVVTAYVPQAEEVAKPTEEQPEATAEAAAEAEALVTEPKVTPVQSQPTAPPKSPPAEKTAVAAADVSMEDSGAAAAPATVSSAPTTEAAVASPSHSAPRAAAKRKADEATQVRLPHPAERQC
jgi:hypothetical protein